MIAIAVLAILLSVAVPSFNDATLGSRLSSEANRLVASVNLARGEAIHRNAVVTMCPSANGVSCAATGGWEQGWIVRNGATVILAQQALPTGLRVISSVNQLVFQATGVGATAATLTVCRDSPTVGGQERVVAISATGRTSVSRTSAGSCG
jgi:type IV fimbrial biogenesis protein FimT